MHRQKVEDAWWTGPVIAANADTLPPGHVYVEPYLYDVLARNSSTPGSLSYLLYGVAPRFTAGFLPSFSYARDARGDRRLRMGDVTIDVQYRLTAANPRKTTPSIAIVLQQRLPTAPFDRLSVAGSGAGSGDYATLLGLYWQQYFWMPSGRIVRARVNLTHTFEGRARVNGLSVYGTPEGFRGTAKPGDSTMIVVSAEYSFSKNFVLAFDAVHQWQGSTAITDASDSAPKSMKRLPASRYFALVPGVEYNWSSSEGVILGCRWIPKDHNMRSSVTPVIAYSRFF